MKALMWCVVLLPYAMILGLLTLAVTVPMPPAGVLAVVVAIVWLAATRVRWE